MLEKIKRWCKENNTLISALEKMWTWQWHHWGLGKIKSKLKNNGNDL